MRSRSLLVIVLIGIVGMVAFGLCTKLALDSNEDLQRVAGFQQRILLAYEARGVEEVTYSRLRGRDVQLRIAIAEERAARLPDLDAELGALLVTDFPQARGKLRIVRCEPASWFGEPTPYSENELSCTALRRQVREHQRRFEIAADVETNTGLQLRELTADGADVRCCLATPEPQVSWGDELERRVRAALDVVRRKYHVRRGARMLVRIEAPATEPCATDEADSGTVAGIGTKTAWAAERNEPRVLAEGEYDPARRHLHIELRAEPAIGSPGAVEGTSAERATTASPPTAG